MIYNLTKRSLIARRAIHAEGLWLRGRGMIGRDFDKFDAMVFERCSAIHTLFMGSSIDVLFIDAENRVLRALRELKPWRFLVHCLDARAVIELPPGAIEESNTEVGDAVDLRAEINPEALAELANDGKGKFITQAGALAPLEETEQL